MIQTIKFIAFYLPQFHPIPENDQWWGKGFTEWTNTGKAIKLFPGHYQPHVPADLGYYDLRVPETREAQAEMAMQYGIDGFCYYHYWFGGKRLLERPFNEVLESGSPVFPFCLCWANESWSGKWHGFPEKILIEQTYPGLDDHKSHMRYLIRAFRDERYIKVDGRPMFLIYQPTKIPDIKQTIKLWRDIAKENEFEDIYLVGIMDYHWDHKEYGFDAKIAMPVFHAAAMGELKGTRKMRRLLRKCIGIPPDIYQYRKIFKKLLVGENNASDCHPCVIPNWDNSPRCGRQGVIFHNSTPELFREHLKDVMKQVKGKEGNNKFVYIKSWNEWAEGNHLEPDLKYGKKFLEVIRDEKKNMITFTS